MSEGGNLWWTKDVPADGYTITERDGDHLVISCYAPGEPPPEPPPPASSGISEWVVGEHNYKLEWQYEEGTLVIVDFDEWLSTDGVQG